MKIPKRVNLGFGYVVQIRYCTRAQMIQRAVDEHMGDVPDGYWDSDTRLIWIINDDMSMARQRYVYAHEMHHAIVDFMDEFLDTWTISERKLPALQQSKGNGTHAIAEPNYTPPVPSDRDIPYGSPQVEHSCS